MPETAKLAAWQIAFRNSVYDIFDIPKPTSPPLKQPEPPKSPVPRNRPSQKRYYLAEPPVEDLVDCPRCVWRGPRRDFRTHRIEDHG